MNTAIDLRGEVFLMDLVDSPEQAAGLVGDLAAIIERFGRYLAETTGTTSISVNRNVRHVPRPVFLHSECSNVMISTATYERMFLPFDVEWSRRLRPFGIHHCGADPHRFAASYAKVPGLDFLDVGWGGDVALLRRHLPRTFLNLRLSPVEIAKQTAGQNPGRRSAGWSSPRIIPGLRASVASTWTNKWPTSKWRQFSRRSNRSGPSMLQWKDPRTKRRTVPTPCLSHDCLPIFTRRHRGQEVE